jgi:putative Mn2+ efflux pump MntP
MPLIGVVIGRALGHAVGSLADYVASVVLVALGVFVLFSSDDQSGNVSTLAHIHGPAIIGLGIGISLGELAIGLGNWALKIGRLRRVRFGPS